MSKSNVNDAMKKVASSFVSEEPTYDVLKEGTHRVRPVKIRITHSFLKADGSAKEGPFEWLTPTPVVAITYADINNKMVMHRHHLLGHKDYDKLTSKQKENDAYSCAENGKALFEGDRIKDEKKTQSCVSILSGVFKSFGLPIGSTLDDLQGLVDKGECEVDIVVQKADGGNFVEVAKVMPIVVTDEIQEFE